MRITFLGDIMCKLELTKLLGIQGDYRSVFEPCRDLFNSSDYVVGNLETPVAGSNSRICDDLYSFCAPSAFVEAMRDVGINVVTTANNHCLDRGTSGLEETITALDKLGVLHTGTFLPTEVPLPLVLETNAGIKFALVAYTSRTNFHINHKVLSKRKRHFVNMLKKQTVLDRSDKEKRRFSSFDAFLFKALGNNYLRFYKVKRALGLSYVKSYTDGINPRSINPDYLDKVKRDLQYAKENADFVFFLPHCGGQWNDAPGDFVKYIVQFAAENGADAVVANHPHNVQKFEQTGSVPCAYYLGNYLSVPSSITTIHTYKPEYSIALHFDFDVLSNEKTPKLSYSILKIVEEKRSRISVRPLVDIYRNEKSRTKKRKLLDDASYICSRFMNERIVLDDLLERFEIRKEPKF